MSLWGNKDKITIAGTYNLSNSGMLGIAGASGFPASDVTPGDSVIVGTAEYIVKTVIGATAMTISTTGFGGATGLPTQSGATIYVQQKPKHVESLTERKNIYGVDTTEMGVAGSKGAGHAGWVKNSVGSGYITGMTVNVPGSGYAGTTAGVIVSGTGGASGVAVMLPTGKVSSVTITAPGQYTTTAPTVTFIAPTAFSFNSSTVVSSSAETVNISVNPHYLLNGDPLTYSKAGATGAMGLAAGTEYFVRLVGATGLQFYTSAAAAIAGTTGALVDLTADGSPGQTHTLTGRTAGATGILMGGRFGRTMRETLVAMGIPAATMNDAENVKYPNS